MARITLRHQLRSIVCSGNLIEDIVAAFGVASLFVALAAGLLLK